MSFIRWHPQTGEHRIVERTDEVPPDWLDHHPEDPRFSDKSEPAQAGQTASKPLSPKEVKFLLTDGGIPFDSKANLADLTELLDTNVKAALLANEVHFDEAEPLRDLVDKLTAALERKAA